MAHLGLMQIKDVYDAIWKNPAVVRFLLPTETTPMFVDSRRLSPTPTTLTMLSMAFDKAGDRATAMILLGLAYVMDNSITESLDCQNNKYSVMSNEIKICSQ